MAETGNTKTLGIHKICMFSLVAIGSDGRLLYEKNIETACNDTQLASKECTKKFISHLLELEPWFKEMLQIDKSDKPSEADMDKLFSDTKCQICENDLDWEFDLWPAVYEKELIKRGLRSKRLLVTDVPDSETDERYSVIQHHHLHR